MKYYFFLALLRAMAEKIIPGISFSTCIAILQQTNLQNERGNDRESNQEGTVLEFVLSSDRVRNRAVQTANRKLAFRLLVQSLCFVDEIDPSLSL